MQTPHLDTSIPYLPILTCPIYSHHPLFSHFAGIGSQLELSLQILFSAFFSGLVCYLLPRCWQWDVKVGQETPGQSIPWPDGIWQQRTQPKVINLKMVVRTPRQPPEVYGLCHVVGAWKKTFRNLKKSHASPPNTRLTLEYYELLLEFFHVMHVIILYYFCVIILLP